MQDDIGPSLEDDNEVNFSNFRRRILVISDSVSGVNELSTHSLVIIMLSMTGKNN